MASHYIPACNSHQVMSGRIWGPQTPPHFHHSRNKDVYSFNHEKCVVIATEWNILSKECIICLEKYYQDFPGSHSAMRRVLSEADQSWEIR